MKAVWMSSLAMVCGLAGCQAPTDAKGSSAPPEPVPVVDAVHLSAPMHAAVSLRGGKTPDALQVQAYFETKGHGAPATVKGSLSFYVYDVAAKDVAGASPFFTWSFPNGELATHLKRTMFGYGYEFLLFWGDRAPRSSRLVLVAMYQPPQAGPAVYSDPLTILLGAD